MCSFKTLYRNEHGYITRCSSCRHLHIGFGTTVLALNQEQFETFGKTIDSYYQAHRNRQCRDQKAIRIPTIVNSILLLYSVNELASLSHLLCQAREEIRREQLFAFNLN